MKKLIASPTVFQPFVNKKKGFTLIELLIVVAIIGVLATVGLITFTSAQKNVRNSRRKADVTSIAKAAEVYYQQQSPNAYPANISDATLGTYFPSGKVPVDPVTANGAYVYTAASGSTPYKICAPASYFEPNTLPLFCLDGAQ